MMAYNVPDGIIVRLTSRLHQRADTTTNVGSFYPSLPEDAESEAAIMASEWMRLTADDAKRRWEAFGVGYNDLVSKSKRSALKFIIDPWVSDSMSQQLITEAVKGSPSKELTPLPGATFPIGDLGFCDILGSPSGHLLYTLLYIARKKIGWTMSQQHKVVKMVTAYRYEDQGGGQDELEKNPACLV